jgi:hypothetical protein
MPNCAQCGKQFDPSDAKSEYEAEFGSDLDYTESYGGEVCGDCAISQSQSDMNLGRAIDMMNSEEAYDEDFVREHL